MLSAVGTMPPGARPFARAVIIRQALEIALDEHWGLHSPPMLESSTASQLSCLRVRLDTELVGSLKLAWKGLSRSMHSTGYDHPPSDDELNRYRNAIERLIASS